MKLEKTVLANTFAITTAVIWIICAVGVALFPQLSFQIFRWWNHGLIVSPMGDYNVTFVGFIMGGIVLVAFAWIAGYIFGVIWEFMSKR